MQGLRLGDRVAYLQKGAYAEYTAAAAVRTARVPPAAGLAPGHAAAALLQGMTALTLVREAYAVQRGEWILVHAAAGGVGLWLCQVLRALGARTIGTASSAEKLVLAEENGARWVIDNSTSTEEDIVDRVMALTGGEGVRCVYDGVGKTTFDLSMRLVARKGSVVSFGNASGAVPPVSLS